MPFSTQDEGDFPAEDAFDPEGVIVVSDGPGELSEFSFPLDGTTSDDEAIAVSDTTAQDGSAEAGEEYEPLPEFDPQAREPLEGLLFIGKLTREFNWLGHKFVIRTLRVDEIMEIGLLHREYVGTIGDVPAYRACLVAACIERVDGQPIALGLGPANSDLEARFMYVRTNWYQITIDTIYEQWLVLEGQSAEVMAAMGKVRGRTAASIPG